MKQSCSRSITHFPTQVKTTNPGKQTAKRSRTLVLCRDSSQQPEPERQCDAVAKCLVPCAVGYLLALALCVDVEVSLFRLVPFANLGPSVREALKSFALKSERRKPSNYCSAYVIHFFTPLPCHCNRWWIFVVCCRQSKCRFRHHLCMKILFCCCKYHSPSPSPTYLNTHSAHSSFLDDYSPLADLLFSDNSFVSAPTFSDRTTIITPL